jgi:serine/threonine protein kinase
MADGAGQDQEQQLAGKYRLLRLLKEGGMGSVYVAVEVDTGREVAIKLLRDGAAGSPEAVQRLANEARAASAVGHPGIVEVIELDEDDNGLPFLVMELLKGQSLDDLLLQKGKLKPELAVGIVAQALSALAAAHEKGIVHRDLKPENIFISTGDGGKPQVKLLDFGISKIWLDGATLNLTQTGTVWGTPYYMSPEHARGAKDIDGQTDIWAIGVILYQILTGTLPYDGETYNELLAKILGDPFTPPRQIDPVISRPLEQVILKAMSKERKHRYRSATTFRDELIRAAHGSGPSKWFVGAGPLRRGKTTRKGRSRKRWAVAAIVSVLALGAVTGLNLSSERSGAAPMGDQTTPSPPTAEPHHEGIMDEAPGRSLPPEPQVTELRDADIAPDVGDGSAEETLVELRVRAFPLSARPIIRIDGMNTPDGVTRVAREGVHRITITASGYQREEIHRRIPHDMELDVQLTREQSGGGSEDGNRPSISPNLPRYRQRDVGIVTEYPQ